MILATSYTVVLVLSLVSMLLLGLWLNSFKATQSSGLQPAAPAPETASAPSPDPRRRSGWKTNRSVALDKWRFELYYFDFAFGVVAASLLAAITMGSFGSELSFSDNLMVTGKRQIGYAIVAGSVFNLGNMLLLAGVSLGGIAIAAVLSACTFLSFGAILNYLLGGRETPWAMLGGSLVMIGAAAAAMLAYEAFMKERNPGKRKLGVGKTVAVSLISGVLMSAALPIRDLSKGGEIGLGPYAAAFCFALGMLFSTFPLSIYFMNLPIQGEALSFGHYLRGNLKWHIMGVIGGGIWAIGTLCALLSASPAGDARNLSPLLARLIPYSSPIVAALCGIALWKEFEGSGPRVRTLITAALGCLVAAIGLLAGSQMLAK